MVYKAEILHRGQTYTIDLSPDQTVLQSAQAAGLDLPSSCTAGVCTTCAAKLHSGEVDQSEAMGLSPSLMEQGFALLCVAYPRSDLRLETDQEDTVYHLQFGRPTT